MPPATLLASAVLAYASALGFVAVAALSLRGQENGGARLAFAVFWVGAAVVAAAQGTRSFTAYNGWDSFALLRALDQTATPAYCMSAAGLAYYVLYLLTGRQGLATLVAAYYFGMIPLLRYYVEAAQPVGYVVRDWQVNLVYAHGTLQSLGYTIALALTALPVVASVLAYLVVPLRLARSAASRYRSTLLALGLTIWVSTELLAWSSGAVNTTWGELARRSAGLAVTAVVLVGYLPPAAARRRWGARAIGEPAA